MKSMGECKGFLVFYFVYVGMYESIIVEIVINVGRNDFMVDVVVRDKVFVLLVVGRLRCCF